MGRFLFLSVFSLVFLASCGPAKTARATEEDQQDAVIAKQRAAMASVEGNWAGTFTPQFGDTDGHRPGPISLQIIAISLLQPVPNRNETVEVPSLNGVLKSNTTTAIIFTSGLYSEKSGRIQMMSSVETAGATVAPSILQLNLQGPNKLTGRLIAPQVVGTVVLNRTK